MQRIVKDPTGPVVIELLLHCAPQKALADLGLSSESAQSEARYLDELRDGAYGEKGLYYFNQYLILALYYSSRKRLDLLSTSEAGRRVMRVLESLYIAPHVLHGLIELARTEEFSATEHMLTEISVQKVSAEKKRIAKKPRKSTQKEEDRKTVQDYWARWQKEPKLYTGVTEFDEDMLEKTEIRRRNTISDWRKILENGKSLVE